METRAWWPGIFKETTSERLLLEGKTLRRWKTELKWRPQEQREGESPGDFTLERI